MNKILITGGSGFIGKNLAEGLNKKNKIYIPSSKELNLLNKDIVENYLKKNKFDTVIHCATYNATVTSTKDLNFVLESNLKMFFNIARCNKMYRKMIYFGSGAEYDNKNYIPKMREEYFDTHVPNDQYGFSKYIMAKYAEKSSNILDLVLFGVFGKYEDFRIRFISNAICKTLFNQDITIKQNIFFDYLYIDDLIKIVEIFITKKKFNYRRYNICSGRSIDLLTLAKIVRDTSSKKIRINVFKKGLKPEYTGDNNRFIKEFGKFSFTDFEYSIQYLFNWYEEHKEMIKKEKLI